MTQSLTVLNSPPHGIEHVTHDMIKLLVQSELKSPRCPTHCATRGAHARSRRGRQDNIILSEGERHAVYSYSSFSLGSEKWVVVEPLGLRRITMQFAPRCR